MKQAIVQTFVLLWASILYAASLGSTFTYQGRLDAGGIPANDLYEMQFALYDGPTNGMAVGTPLVLVPVTVTNGIFTVSLDFGPAAFDGRARWLEISLKLYGSGLPSITVAPRQRISVAPYALHAVNAGGLMSAGIAPLDIKVNGQRALRLEATISNTFWTEVPNVIGGSSNNSVDAGVYGATIAGGGGSYLGQPLANRVSASFGTVGGGERNACQATGATVAGGQGNLSSGGIATIGGGGLNLSSGLGATVGGGSQNSSTGGVATVGGGNLNVSGGFAATVSGGVGNRSAGDAATVSGGSQNTSSGEAATVGGGSGNAGAARFATVGGGLFNSCNGQYGTIGGGEENLATTNYATVSGGKGNRNTAEYATIGGGSFNQNFGSGATIGGGSGNSTAGHDATVAGGAANYAGSRGAVGGGYFNTADGDQATVPGGTDNNASGTTSFAAGRRGKARHDGAFVWADSTDADFESTATDEFSVRAGGGVRFVTAVDTNDMPISGAALAPGAGSWTSMSDRNAKENFQPVDSRTVLDKVTALPLSTWNYKSQTDQVRHIGPMAQDFKAAFGVGETDTGITTIDADGVALAAIQGLNQKLESELKSRDAENAQLKERLAQLEELVRQLSRP